jgi:hypothetical protein
MSIMAVSCEKQELFTHSSRAPGLTSGFLVGSLLLICFCLVYSAMLVDNRGAYFVFYVIFVVHSYLQGSLHLQLLALKSTDRSFICLKHEISEK